MYISIEQALEVYDELLLCKNGENGFGGSIAEIYAYKLMPYAPTYSMHVENNIFDEDNRLLEKKAAEDFHSLCHIFAKKHNVNIKINEVEIHEWIEKIRTGEFRFYHRIHVSVEPK